MINNLTNALAELYQEGGEAVLVTLCATTGSTPRKAGAKMLVYQGGKAIGTIGGGALEHEALMKAEDVLKTGKSVLVERPLQELGMVCGGAGTLFFEYLSS